MDYVGRPPIGQCLQKIYSWLARAVTNVIIAKLCTATILQHSEIA